MPKTRRTSRTRERKFSALNPSVVASGLDVPIARALPLNRVREAHRLVEQDHLLGKVVLTTR